MSLGLLRVGQSIGSNHPVKPAIFSFAHSAAVVGGHLLAENIVDRFARARRWLDGGAPAMSPVLRADQVAAEEREVPVVNDLLHFRQGVGLNPGPPVAAADQ